LSAVASAEEEVEFKVDKIVGIMIADPVCG